MSWTKKLGALVLAAGTLAGGATASRAAALTPGDQSLIPIAAFTASGNTERLKGALEDGLKNGLTINEIKDELVQMYAYTGFPRSLTALSVFMNLLNERRAQGITDTAGRKKVRFPRIAASSNGGRPRRQPSSDILSKARFSNFLRISTDI